MATRQLFLRLRAADRPTLDRDRRRTVDLRLPLESSPVRRLIKRGIDLALGVLVLVGTLPVTVLVSLAIVIDSRGAPIFVHRRLGKDGAEFGLLKFRTMTRHAEQRHEECFRGRPSAVEEWQGVWKLRADPRVTRLGRFLRRCSVDELPQLINVIRGDMSLVGPRPVVRQEIERFDHNASLVLSVRPGMTGLWAVSGRNDVSYEDRVRLESRYVRSWSLRLDLRILLRTIPRAVGCKGAY